MKYMEFTIITLVLLLKIANIKFKKITQKHNIKNKLNVNLPIPPAHQSVLLANIRGIPKYRQIKKEILINFSLIKKLSNFLYNKKSENKTNKIKNNKNNLLLI